MRVRAVAGAAALLWVAACGRHPAAHTAAPPTPAVPVTTAVVSAGRFQAVEEVLGTVRPKTRARIEAKVSARIERLAVVAGQVVRAGDVIAELDTREIQARLGPARALLEQASKELERFKKLQGQQAVTQQEFEAVESRFRVAQGAETEAATQLSYTRIVAPFDGVITRKLADVGDLAAPGRALVEIEDPKHLRLEADVSEAWIGRVKPGDTLPVRIGGLPALVTGVVSEIAPAADPGSRTFLVTLDLPAQTGARAGQFGRALLPVGASEALQAPEKAVRVRGQMEQVFVVADGAARLRLVKTGKHQDGRVELLSGVDTGETVVVDGPERLEDGQPVTAQPAGAAR